MAFRFECKQEDTNSNKFFELDIVPNPIPDSGECVLLIRHSAMGQDHEFKQYKSAGSNREIMQLLKYLILRRKDYGYLPVGKASENISDGAGWLDWRKHQEPKEEEDVDNSVAVHLNGSEGLVTTQVVAPNLTSP